MTLGRPFLSAAAAAAALLAAPQPAAAEPIADFYRGKTLRMIIGYGPGGGYDLYGRVFAEYFGKYVPGNPTVVAQNMDGAGSFIAAKYLYSVAPHDGTAFGSLAQTLPLDAAMSASKDLDATKMPYVGRMTSNIDIGMGMPGANFTTGMADARNKVLIVGATGASSPGFLLPTALNQYGGTKFKIIYGYKGSNDVSLAAERKEVDVIGSIGLPVVMAKSPDWVTEKKAPAVYQAALTRHPLLQHVPTLAEYASNDEGKQILSAIAASAEIGRSINTTPNVPSERLDALRAAFQRMVTDKDFLAEMQKRKIAIEPLTGPEVDKIALDTLKTPKPVLDKIKALVEQK
jgi:tripartite-type tricarboxylate transporter receptor subunit TctC